MDKLQVTATFPDIAPGKLAEFKQVAAAVGDLLPRLMELGGGMQIEAFGSLSPALSEAAAALQPTVYSYLQGL